jgi:hypothetical protein
MSSLFSSLDHVEDEFRLYIEKLQIDFPVWLESQSAEFDDGLHLLLTYYYYMNYIADCGILSGSHQGTLLLASKTTSDLLGIYSCLKSGCVHQSSTLIRSLFETAVATKFIYVDYEKRVNLFYNFKYIEQYNRMLKDPTTIEVYKQAEIKRKYQQFKSDYIPRSSWYCNLLLSIIENSPTLRRKHKRPTLSALCDVIEMNEDYHRVYDSLSLTTHGSSVLDHLFVANGNFTAAPMFTKLIFTEASLAMNYAHKVISPILKEKNNEEADRIIDYSTWLLFASLEIARRNS